MAVVITEDVAAAAYGYVVAIYPSFHHRITVRRFHNLKEFSDGNDYSPSASYFPSEKDACRDVLVLRCRGEIGSIFMHEIGGLKVSPHNRAVNVHVTIQAIGAVFRRVGIVYFCPSD